MLLLRLDNIVLLSDFRLDNRVLSSD